MLIKTKHIVVLCATILCLILSIISVSHTYSKFLKESETNNPAVVAPYVVNLHSLVGDESEIITINLNEINPDSGVQEYVLVVANGTLENYSSVSMNYNITITTTGYLPLNIQLKDSENNEVVSLSPIIDTDTSNDFDLDVGQYVAHQYKLEIVWNNGEGLDSSIYAGLMDVLNIVVNWEQSN